MPSAFFLFIVSSIFSCRPFVFTYNFYFHQGGKELLITSAVSTIKKSQVNSKISFFFVCDSQKFPNNKKKIEEIQLLR